MSNDVIRFCNTEGIEIVKSTVNDHRATECVERTIGSLKNKILTYAKEENPEALGNMLERALSVNATAKLTTFEAHHWEGSKYCLKKSHEKTFSSAFELVESTKRKIFMFRRSNGAGPSTPGRYKLGCSFGSGL